MTDDLDGTDSLEGLELLESLFRPERASQRAQAALERADRECRELAEHIQGEIVHDLTAIGLSLSLAAEADRVVDDPRSPLTARRRSILQCTRLLSAVAEQLSPGGG